MYETRLGSKEFDTWSEEAIKSGKCLLVEDVTS